MNFEVRLSWFRFHLSYELLQAAVFCMLTQYTQMNMMALNIVASTVTTVCTRSGCM